MAETSAISASLTSASVSQTAQRAKPVGAVLSAVILAMFVLYGAGFAPQEIAHNAAHDSRHSFAFPCH